MRSQARASDLKQLCTMRSRQRQVLARGHGSVLAWIFCCHLTGTSCADAPVPHCRSAFAVAVASWCSQLGLLFVGGFFLSRSSARGPRGLVHRARA